MTSGGVLYFVYIVLCSNGSYYIGHANDLEARIRYHNHGYGALWTKAYRPVKLVWREEHATLESALKREWQIKGWSRRKKKALIDSNFDLLKKL